MPIFAIYILSSWSDFWHGGDCHRACIVLKDFTAYLGAWIKSRISCSAISLIKFTKGIAILSPSLITINSASVVLSATSVCIFDAQVTGHPAYITPYPVPDLAVILSTCAVSALQLPQKSASTIGPSFVLFLSWKLYPLAWYPLNIFLFSKLLACVTPLGHLWILHIDGLHMLYPAWSIFQENLVVLWPECIPTLCAAPCLLCPCVGFTGHFRSVLGLGSLLKPSVYNSWVIIFMVLSFCVFIFMRRYSSTSFIHDFEFICYLFYCWLLHFICCKYTVI